MNGLLGISCGVWVWRWRIGMDLLLSALVVGLVFWDGSGRLWWIGMDLVGVGGWDWAGVSVGGVHDGMRRRSGPVVDFLWCWWWEAFRRLLWASGRTFQALRRVVRRFEFIIMGHSSFLDTAWSLAEMRSRAHWDGNGIAVIGMWGLEMGRGLFRFDERVLEFRGHIIRIGRGLSPTGTRHEIKL